MHHGRVSSADAIYFVTYCLKSREPALTTKPVADDLLRFAQAMDGSKDTFTYAFTVMPDHCHWLFQLTGGLSLSQVVAKFKFLSRHLLAARGLSWQRDFYDHRLRPEEAPEDYALYVFLNPYRAGLLPSDAAWPWWWSAQLQSLHFPAPLNPSGGPPAEWIELAVPASVRHGE